jgi:hypothetical protein
MYYIYFTKQLNRHGLEKADNNIHENAPQNDVTIHEGLCQGGHSTDALDDLNPTPGENGCENENIISDPGNSDGHHK